MFKYTAVIVEPRRHNALEYVLNNFCENLSDEWGFIIFHGTENYDYIINIIENKLSEYKNRFVNLIDLGIENLTINEYSNLLYKLDFYEKIPTETFLIFQTDTLINPTYKNLINNFIEYDYVGAPWSAGFALDDKGNYLHVGNGGLSLRKKSKTIEILKQFSPNDNAYEDTFFSKYFKIMNYNIPSVEIAKTFSIETIFNPVFFGVHAPWRHLNFRDVINIFPEVKQLYDLQ
jgi:hypothetical protein